MAKLKSPNAYNAANFSVNTILVSIHFFSVKSQKRNVYNQMAKLKAKHIKGIHNCHNPDCFIASYTSYLYDSRKIIHYIDNNV